MEVTGEREQVDLLINELAADCKAIRIAMIDWRKNGSGPEGQQNAVSYTHLGQADGTVQQDQQRDCQACSQLCGPFQICPIRQNVFAYHIFHNG